MISDEPDEDAEGFDDDTVIESILGDAGIKPDNPTNLPLLPEWPARDQHVAGIQVDTETVRWFQSTHQDWQRQMGLVLRAWMIANTANQTPEAHLPSAVDPS